jgi:hypothetical protein
MSYAGNELAAYVTSVICIFINAGLALNGLAASITLAVLILVNTGIANDLYVSIALIALAVLVIVNVSVAYDLNVSVAVITFAVGVCIGVFFTSCGIISTAGIALMIHIGIDVRTNFLITGSKCKHRSASKSKCENHNQNFLHLVYPFKAVLVLQTVNQPATGS